MQPETVCISHCLPSDIRSAPSSAVMSRPVWDQYDAYNLQQKDLEAYLKGLFPEQQNEIEVKVRSNLGKH